MRKSVFTKTGNKVRIYVRVPDDKKASDYVIRARLTGECPCMLLAFGNEYADGFTSWDFEGRHTFKNQQNKPHEVLLDVSKNNIIDYIEPCGGHCDCELVDLSEAPDIISAYIKQCDDVKLNNPAMRRLEMYVMNASDIDVTGCVGLRELTIGCGYNVTELDLTKCVHLESLRISDRTSKALTNIKLNEDCPLQYADVRGCKLNDDCISTIRRIIERNNGIFEDYVEKLRIM